MHLPTTPENFAPQVECSAAVQDVVLLPDGRTVVVGVRDSNYLVTFDLETPESRSKINMNERDDEHVSFYAQQLHVSPCGRYLLVATEGPRMFVLRIGSWQRVRSMYGLPVETFHKACVSWHGSSRWLFAAAAGGRVFVFHVGSCKEVRQLSGHKINVRDMHYDASRKLLATCSFDKTVKVWSAAAGPDPSTAKA